MSSGIKDLIYGLTHNLANDKYVPGGWTAIKEATYSSYLEKEELASLFGSALYLLDGKVEEYRNTRQLLDHVFACTNKALQELKQANENQDWRGVQNAIEQLVDISKIKDQLSDN